MIKTIILAGTLAAGAVGNAAALPSGIGTTGSAPTPSLQNVDYRRCWYDDGVRHCRWVRTDYYDDYDDGYWGGPVVGFSFGGGAGHFHGGHFGGHGGHGHR